jgi:hypothetical protein
VEYSSDLGSMINDARRTSEMKSRIAMTRVAFNRKKTLSPGKFDLKFRRK